MSDEDRALNSLAHLLQADGLPGVITTNRPLRDISRDVLAYLSRVPTLNLYIRHGQLVRIQQSEDGAPCLEVLSEAICKGVLTRHLNFVKFTAKGTPQHAAPPDIVVRDIMALGSWPFSPIETLIEFPVFRPDGTLVDSPGYDRLMRLVYVPVETLKIPPIPARPSQQDIAAALALLHELIGEFPFEDKASYANALALLLTPLIRQYINGHVPLALIDATRPGTGKSLLAEIVAMIATGRQAAMMPAPYDDDEWRKRIASTLAKGATVITIDNIKGKLQAASLDLALTSYVFEDRILGQSKMGTYAQRATWMATGNNIQLGGDLPRRSYWIRMDAHTDKPWARTSFKHDLNTWVPEHRADLIAALLTLARAWFAVGKPAANVPPIGSFQPWVDTIGGILAYVGIEGFLGNLPTLYEQADEDATQWAAFLRAWREHYEDQEVRVATLVKDIKAGALDGAMLGVGLYNALPDDLADIQKGDFRRRLGKALSARIGSQFDESGLHLVKASLDSRSGSAYWKVVDAQMPQRVLPQNEDVSGQIAPSEDRGSAANGNAPPKIFSPGEGNLSAKTAHLRNYQAPFGCEHLALQMRVRTPQGNGIVMQCLPHAVGVILDRTREMVYFYLEDEIAAMVPLPQVDEDASTGEEAFVPGPEDWPYSDPTWGEQELADHGYGTRKALHYRPPALRWHFERLQNVNRVMTSQGPGYVLKNEPGVIWVKLDESTGSTVFETLEEIARIEPIPQWQDSGKSGK